MWQIGMVCLANSYNSSNFLTFSWFKNVLGLMITDYELAVENLPSNKENIWRFFCAWSQMSICLFTVSFLLSILLSHSFSVCFHRWMKGAHCVASEQLNEGLWRLQWYKHICNLGHSDESGSRLLRFAILYQVSAVIGVNVNSIVEYSNDHLM